MKLDLQKPATALKSYFKENIERAHFESFKNALHTYLAEVSHAESIQATEENFKAAIKNLLSALFKISANPFSINTLSYKGNIEADMVIFDDWQGKGKPNVMLEVKKPANRGEMVTQENANQKALQEAVTYYMLEKTARQNHELAHIIITDCYDWYIFDAAEFNRRFYQDAAFRSTFTRWKNGATDSQSTAQMYEIVRQYLNKEGTTDLAAIHINLRKYKNALDKPPLEKELITVFKLLSPRYLLKEQAANDSNQLNKQFYNELLHIIGLEEYKDKGKKIIRRKAAPDTGSLLENTIDKLRSGEKLGALDNKSQYGDTEEEQLFNLALELCITWVNRILFLKLLEGQLIRYHQGNKAFAFLNKKLVPEYDEMDTLFFNVLARKEEERNPERVKSFQDLPYLNSSLFEPTQAEIKTLTIASLRDNTSLPVMPGTVLKDGDNSLYRKGGKTELRTLHYLLDFLDAYDFGAESAAGIRERNKTIINAAVLGLIFEKINGYRDGSFFTPGFITMYMCRETIRQAVVDKFNEAHAWNCPTYNDLHRYMRDISLIEANAVVNSLRICDPAVGSGHFLVSALNEIIAIKAELGILRDDKDKALHCDIQIENDELIITLGHSEPFEYTVAASQKLDKWERKVDPRTAVIQETLFREKQYLIENCLFGVDINPNSVKICRLRLWIELLKNAYYTPGSQYTRLDTLPNIDINIKCGNSLVSRFTLDADIESLAKNSDWTVQQYRMLVTAYKEAEGRDAKKGIEQQLEKIRKEFGSKLMASNLKFQQLTRFNNELINKYRHQQLFDEKLNAAQIKDKQRLESTIEKLNDELEMWQNGAIFRNSFEWRYEFPEVLDDEGNFRGFDVVIGNPPYIRQEELKAFKPYFSERYKTYTGTADLYVYFTELGMELLKPNGLFIYIMPNKWMRTSYGEKLRHWLGQSQLRLLLDFGDLPVFEEATTYPSIISLRRASPIAGGLSCLVEVDTLAFESLGAYVQAHGSHTNQAALQENGWRMGRQDTLLLLQKLQATGVPLAQYVEGKIYRGILTGLNEAFVIDGATRERLIAEDPKSEEIIKPFLAGRDIKRYAPPQSERYLILFPKGFTKSLMKKAESESAWSVISSSFPAVAKRLKPFEDKAQKRQDKGDYWWELRACDYYEEFEKPKIICPAIIQKPSYSFDTTGYYSNDKTSIIVSENKYLYALLNSKLLNFFMRNISSTKQNGYYEYKPMYISNLPIKTKGEEINNIGLISEQIISLKAADPKADTTTLEAEIDQLVYQLYALTEEEIKIVEEAVK